MHSKISEGGYDMRTHYTVIKIIANLPENGNESLGGIKERARVGFKAREAGAAGRVWPRPSSLQFASHTALGYRLEQNQAG